MAWNNTALYIGITIGSMIGGYVISNWGYSLLPYVCSVAAIVSFMLSTQKVQEAKKNQLFQQIHDLGTRSIWDLAEIRIKTAPNLLLRPNYTMSKMALRNVDFMHKA